MPIETVYKNDYGYSVDIQIEEYDWDTETWIPMPISGFSSFLYKVEKPDGTVQEVTPSLKTDGSDGFLRFTTTPDTKVFTQKGAYQIQAVVSGGGQRFHSSIYRVDINQPLGE